MTSLLFRTRVLLTSCLLLMLSCALQAQEQQDRYGIVNVSVCNTRAEPNYNAGQESQAIMGMPVEILSRHDEWTQIKTPDDYVHWTLTSTLKRVTREELSCWNRAEQVVVTSLATWIYERPSRHAQTVSDAVGGCRLRLTGKRKGFYQVEFPDGRKGFIARKDAMMLSKWRKEAAKDAESIMHTAHTLMGIPYMWGGTSPKGVDCSGFVRTVLYLHDIIIPRNASQQAQTGQRIDIDGDFSNLQTGDLLFFGSKNPDGTPGRVVHVGFYLGNKRFIHSLGCVHTASFNPSDSNFDEYELNRLLFAARILPYINREEKLRTTDRIPLYQ